MLEDLDERQPRHLVGGLERAEHRRLLDAHADIETDTDQQDRHQERNAPAPSHELALAELRDQREHADGGDVADGVADLDDAAQEAAFVGGRVLDHHQHRAAPLPAEPDTLQEAQHHEKNGRSDADLLIGRQQADQERPQSHHDDGDREHRLAADPVAIVSEDRRAERPREKADPVGAERCDGRERRVAGGEEDLVEHQRGRGAVDQEVVPLDRGADDARPDDTAKRCGFGAEVAGTDAFCNGHVVSPRVGDVVTPGSLRAASRPGAAACSRQRVAAGAIAWSCRFSCRASAPPRWQSKRAASAACLRAHARRRASAPTH